MELELRLRRKKKLRLLLNRLKTTNLFLTVKDIPRETRGPTHENLEHPYKQPKPNVITNGVPKAHERSNSCDTHKATHMGKGARSDSVGLAKDVQRLSLNEKSPILPVAKILQKSPNKKTTIKEPAPLGPTALNKVEEILNSRSRVVVEAFNITICREDIFRLRDKQWLNDEIINFYGTLIMERAKARPDQYPSVHVFNTYFYPLLLENGYSKVQRWTRKVDLFSKDLVIIPVHLGVHWCCAIINMKSKRFEYYDPLLSSNPRCLKALRSYLHEEAESKKVDVDLSGWTNYTPKDIPRQENGYDCGVFSCQYAEYASRNSPFLFSQRHMSQLRRQMIYEIASAKLVN
ncbi:cysteine proteinase [Basidiobolus meristosporus CBS 931.73]|uniref:Cysteine proteinase n=1 Tax=Basidiobolus meristosporus CBS 931.73 TaxID=1314790 RepID=A0A1Y1X1C9_9FUNG|nr:cysteine proteinase [Basidiobolus meristosporus CBS 931.73]|eukprot:ORX79617.1 cysteine proteinase [Basidiobolus meristosporus CBS 931.73]